MEVWKDIPGYDGMYQVSNRGRVRSWYNQQHGRRESPRVLKKRLVNGYPIVALYKGEERSRVYVHRLVANAFVPNPRNKPEVNHKNGDKEDPDHENLEWVTSKENQQHALKSDLYNVNGENCKTSKLTAEDVLDIRRLSKNCTGRRLAKMFSVSESNISSIINRKSWRHI